MLFVYLLIIIAVLAIIIKLLEMAQKGIWKLQGLSTELIGLTHIGGIPLLKEGVSSTIGVKDDKLIINDSHFLQLDRVKRVQYLTDQQLLDRQKSVITRALVGGLLLGPVAAVVGGISGVGTTQTKVLQHYLTIDFTDKFGEELSAVFLLGTLGVSDIQIFINDVNTRIGYTHDISSAPTASNPYEI